MSKAPKCGFCKKPLKASEGSGRRKEFCNAQCRNRQWQRLHPRQKVAAD